MSDDVNDTTPGEDPSAPIPFAPPKSRFARMREKRAARPPKPRLRKLRLLLILTGLGVLAFISTVFGMMMSVASDLPQLENRAQYRHADNSVLYDDQWRPIGIFAPPNNVVLVKPAQIAQSMKDAIVSIEDKRFYTNSGVDIRGIGRAFASDVIGGAPRQGASTIAQQFVKNALAQQGNRTVFEKLREAALAYHLTRKWPKEKILTEYLNSIYFGNGAYGVESAARVYFGKAHGFNPASASSQTSVGGCGNAPRPPCVSVLAPYESALIAGVVASPYAYDPILHPKASKDRRDLVLKNMLQQGYITQQQYTAGIAQPLPTISDIERPEEPTAAPYFTSWLRPQIVAAMGSYRAYYGGLKIKTSLDLQMQQAADQAISQQLPSGSGLPSTSLVTIDNKTGEVRAMVGGPIVNGQEDYQHFPFNLATLGHRQPGSSFKPFTLAEALIQGISPDSVWTSAPQDFIVANSRGKGHFIVHNFGDTYSGSISLTGATTVSDNSVYSQVGIKVGTSKIARLAARMGIRSPISNNYAMILGGLTEGVSPLDMAHAYETFAEHGDRVINRVLGAPHGGPVGIEEIQCPVCEQTDIRNHPTYVRVLPAGIAQTVHDILTTVVQSGTATQAAIPGVDVAGKTGTTSNYGDAWFVGWTPELTTAVWVGFPNKLVSMATMYNGGPVEGGTYPAAIWHDFMVQALQILANEQAAKASQHGQTNTTTTDTTGGASGAGTPPASGGAASGGSSGATGATGGSSGATGATGGGTGGGATGGGTGGGATGGGGGGGATGGGGGGATGGGGGATGGGGGGATGGGGGATGGGGGATGGGGGGGATGGGGGATGGGGGATGGGGSSGSGSGGAGLGGG
jgi:penicillin-binding protein 1A